FSRWALSRPPWWSLAQVTARKPFNGGYKGFVTRGAPRPRCLSYLVNGTIVRGAQKSLPIGDKSQQLSIGYEGIVLGNPHVKPGTRPGILPWNGNQAGPYGIHFHRPCCSQKVILVENAGAESSLKEVSVNPGREVFMRV
ncbi:MAG: hypothetical protein V1792_25870, partial [Pseudomonadota bacterium]